jgi:hypothetical protein
MTAKINPRPTPQKPKKGGAAPPDGKATSLKPKPIETAYSRAKAAGGSADMGTGIGNTT